MEPTVGSLPASTQPSALSARGGEISGKGVTQARSHFLQASGLPAAWAGLPQWRILVFGFGPGLHFLLAWAAWRADAQRPRMLHFVATLACSPSAEDLLPAVANDPDLTPLAEALQRQWWGLLPGVHRLRFDDGQVVLTLHVGDTQTFLRTQELTVDTVYLNESEPQGSPEGWTLHALKAVARFCRRGARLATREWNPDVAEMLAQCGFEMSDAPVGAEEDRQCAHGMRGMRGIYNPRWEPRARPHGAIARTAPAVPGDCIVVGGGIAGAATAASLAARGWRVQVLDQAAAPAAGASGLPAGVFAPHVSPDDSVLSRLTRSGVRTTLQQAQALLREGVDWSDCGVLEHRTDGTSGLCAQPAEKAAGDWSVNASAALRDAALLTADDTAVWHAKGGWIRPARWVAALLAQPGITWHGHCAVAQLRCVAPSPGSGAEAPALSGIHEGSPHRWQALNADGQILAEASTMVIAAGAGSLQLLPHRWALQPVRGQVSWGLHPPGTVSLPPFPVNGSGNLVPGFPCGASSDADADAPVLLAWVLGSTFERDVDALPPSAGDRDAALLSNWAKLKSLLPALSHAWAAATHPPHARTWAAVRCTAPDRLPVVGPVDAATLPGLWACTAMGSRGLTLAPLCAELLAARMHGEPLPLDSRLARALGTERLNKS